MNPCLVEEKGPVLVTGGSGFIGSAVVRALAGAGYPVRALVRRTSPTRHLKELGAEPVLGDITDRASVARAMAGIDYVMHVAADYRLWVPRPEDMIRANVDGTRIVMEEARKAGIKRIVHTSSVATLALHDDGHDTTETAALAPDQAIGPYKRSKVIAERLVERMVAEDALPAVIVQPSAPVGPRDVKPTPTGRMIVDAASGLMPAFVDTGLNIVHVDDVAAGHIAALTRGRIGERYILGGDNIALAAILGEVAEEVHRRPPLLRLPFAAVIPLAYCAEFYARLFDATPFVTMDELKMARHRMFFSSAKAGSELGYRPRPHREAIRDAVDWFRSHGYLKTGLILGRRQDPDPRIPQVGGAPH
jgi:dihydroflavonol-4-reductase